ncbi:MAG: cell division protein ZipA [Salinisphaera sp.]|jgi:cell division protein ZipA|nr:cell division protein ZipA [Salinisphaera sp.]
MSIVQWLLLILVIVVVGGAYLYLRRGSGSDPWQGMEEPGEPDPPQERAESLGGDSYIVGVRTVARETPADRKAAAQAQRAADAERRVHEDALPPLRAYRKSPPAVSEPETSPSQKPATRSNGGQMDTAGSHEIPRQATERVDMRAPSAPSDRREIFILYVAARNGQMFDGPAIHEALVAADLKFGLNDMFHRVTEIHGVTESVFAVANMLKPGTLDPVDQDHLRTPGLAMFLAVPGALEGRPAMHDMMETANRLATALGGQVLDDKRALLKVQTAQFMLDEIADIDRRATVAARRR